MVRPRNLDIRREIVRLWERGVRRPSEIAKRLGVPASRVRYYMWKMRREGLLPTGEPHGDLIAEALTHLKGVVVIASYLLSEMPEGRHAEELRKLREHAERANYLLNLYRRMRGVAR